MVSETALISTEWTPPIAACSPTRRTSVASSLQDEARRISRLPVVPTLVPNRKRSNASSLEDVAESTELAAEEQKTCKIPRLSTLTPLPSPLRISKRRARTTSLDALFRHPSLESLEAPLSTSAIAEALVTAFEPLNNALGSHVAHQDSTNDRISAVSLVPLPRGNDEEGNKNEECDTFDVDKCIIQDTESEDEGYTTGHSFEIDLKHPTPRTKRRSIEATSKAASTCALCSTTLKTALESYSFPQTAPAVIQTVRTLYPSLSINKLATPFPSAPKKFQSPTTTTSSDGSTPQPTIVGKSHPVLPPPTPIFCTTCFTTILTLHLCWTCGQPIHRAEERVGCGWAWWHWGCVSCLLCRTPLRPPLWTAAPITLTDSPACKACLCELRELVLMEQREEEAIWREEERSWGWRRRRRRMGRSGKWEAFNDPLWTPGAGSRPALGIGFGLDGCALTDAGAGPGAGPEPGNGDIAHHLGELREAHAARPVDGRRASIQVAKRSNDSSRRRGQGSAGRIRIVSSSSSRVDDRMKWLTRGRAGGRCGSGGEEGDILHRTGRTKRGASGIFRGVLGDLVYPPLPKWMERAPGWRGRVGGGGGGR